MKPGGGARSRIRRGLEWASGGGLLLRVARYLLKAARKSQTVTTAPTRRWSTCAALLVVLVGLAVLAGCSEEAPSQAAAARRARMLRQPLALRLPRRPSNVFNVSVATG